MISVWAFWIKGSLVTLKKITKMRLQIRTLTVSIGGGALKEMGSQLDKAGTRYAKGPRQINLAVALTSLNWTHLKEN